MSGKRIQLKRGTTAQNSTFTGLDGEVTVDTTKKTLVVHDGTTVGGTVLAKDSDVALKVDKVVGKQLSTEDYTTAEKSKLADIAASANNYTHPASGVSAGTYRSVTVDTNGHVTAGTNPTTVSGYGLTDAYTKTEVNTSLALKVNNSEKGVANGVATLDGNGKVVLTQIPDSVLGQLEYMGTWNFTTMPTATQKGQYWIANTSGNGYVVGDWAVWNGSAFDKVDNTDAVASVAGRTGNVVLTKSDVGLASVDNTADSAKNVLSATKWTTPRNIALTGDVTGNINIDGSANVSIATTIAANSVALGTDTTGNYVAGNTAGTGITVTGTAGEGWSPTISIDSTVATLTGAQTLTNKTLQDSTTFIVDNTDATKKVQFDAAGVTTATTRTMTIPNVNGTLITTGDTGTVTSTMIADGTIANTDISASAGIVDTKLATISTAGKVSNSATTATNLNTASAIVARDASGNFSAGNITATLTGNSSTATTLQTGRTIAMSGDVTWTSASFNGSANVTGTSTLATITNSGTGTFKKITTNTKGLVTGTQAVSQTDITGLLGAGSITNTMIANTAVANLSGTNTGDQTITLTGDITGSGTGSFATTLSNSGVTAGTYSKVTVDGKGRVTSGSTQTMEDIPDATFKRSVRAATTANITLSAPQTIDGIALVAGDRILVKDQTTTSQNGIYVVAAGAWARSLDADTSSKIASALVAVDSGTANGGKLFDNDFKTTDTLGTTSMTWSSNLDSGHLLASTSASIGAVAYNGTTAAVGKFDGGTTTPTGTARLNYGGYFYPTYLNLSGSADTATASSHVFVETASDGFVRPKTLANFKTEMFASPTLVTPNIGVATGTSFNSITGLSAVVGTANGTAAVGTSTTVARADHVHPSDTTKVAKVTSTDNAIVRFNGTTGEVQNSDVVIDDSGNVGINNSNPLAKLTISNGSGENIEFMTGTSGVNGGYLRYINRTSSTTRPDMNYYLSSGGGSHKFYTADIERMRIEANGNVLLTSGTGALGYGTGSGGTVTQLTSKSTAVTLNKPTGTITMSNAALASGASVIFNFTNSMFNTFDLIKFQIIAGYTTYDSYKIESDVTNGSLVRVKLTNVSAGSLSESLVLSYTIIKGANS